MFSSVINFSLICQKVIVDQQSSLFSAIDIVNGMTLASDKPIEEYPIRMPANLCLLIDWSENENDEKQTFKARVVITGTDGSESEIHEFPISVEPRKKAMTKVQFSELEVASAGDIVFSIEVLENENWQKVGQNFLRIQIKQR